MRWRQLDEWCLQSEDQRFTITKANVTGWLCYSLFDYSAKDARGNPTVVEFVRGIAPHDSKRRHEVVMQLKGLADARSSSDAPGNAGMRAG